MTLPPPPGHSFAKQHRIGTEPKEAPLNLFERLMFGLCFLVAGAVFVFGIYVIITTIIEGA